MKRRALTRRQREVLVLIANGNTNAQAARWLSLAPATVARHLAEARRILGACDRTQAVALALRSGDIHLDDIRQPA